MFPKAFAIVGLHYCLLDILHLFNVFKKNSNHDISHNIVKFLVHLFEMYMVMISCFNYKVSRCNFHLNDSKNIITL